MRWLSHIVVLVALCVAAPAWAQTQAKSVRHTVKRGETLSSIAAQYGTNVASICRWNGIKPTVVLAPGRKIGVPLPPGARLPAAPASKGTRPAASEGGSWSDYIQTPKRPGYLTLKGYTQSWEGHVVTRSGKVLPAAQRGVETVLSSWRTDSEKPIHPRLVKLIVQVSDVFGGRPIRVVSGYREPRNDHGKNSRHALGHAIDFQIEGVPNWAVVEYLRTLDQVGVGYYPNSHHVHLDVREQTTHWVDVSGPGQRARYVKPKAQPAPGKRQVARSSGSRAR